MLKHKQLILSLSVKWPPRDSEEVEAWLAFVIKRIDMKIARANTLAKNPQAYYCDIAGNRGATGCGILETSHTVLHTWDEDQPARFEYDLYSCAEFAVTDIITLCKPFGIIKGVYHLLDREDNTKLLAERLIEEGKLGEDGVAL